MRALSVVVITRDEAAAISDCLTSVQFADEVIVVDSNSTDATVAIARRLGAQIHVRALDGFASQKNFGIDAARNHWVLILDADERVTAELAAEIAALPDDPPHAGYSIPFRNHVGDRWLRHGGLYPDRHIRLFDRRRARYGPREVHEMLEVDGTIGELAGDIVHLTYADFREYLAKVRRYAPLEAGWIAVRPSRIHVAKVFADRFVRMRGYRDGVPGLLSAALLAYYQVLLRRSVR